MFPLGHVGLTLALRRGAQPAVPALARLPLAWLAVGAMLPDAIDKPLGHLVLTDLNNGRIIAHTLVFLAVLIVAALVAFRAGRGDVAWAAGALAFGTATHLAFDQMWLQPGTLFWPALGWGFPAQEFTFGHWVDALLHDPFIQVTEALGAAALAVEGWVRRPWARASGASA